MSSRSVSKVASKRSKNKTSSLPRLLVFSSTLPILHSIVFFPCAKSSPDLQEVSPSILLHHLLHQAHHRVLQAHHHRVLLLLPCLRSLSRRLRWSTRENIRTSITTALGTNRLLFLLLLATIEKRWPQQRLHLSLPHHHPLLLLLLPKIPQQSKRAH